MFVWLLEGNLLYKNRELYWKTSCLHQAGRNIVQFHTAQPFTYCFWRGLSHLGSLGPSEIMEGVSSLLSDYKVGWGNTLGQGLKMFSCDATRASQSQINRLCKKFEMWRRDNLTRFRGTFPEVFRKTIRRVDRLQSHLLSTQSWESQWTLLFAC